MAFTWGQFHGKYWRYLSLLRVWKSFICDYSHILQGQWVKQKSAHEELTFSPPALENTVAAADSTSNNAQAQVVDMVPVCSVPDSLTSILMPPPPQPVQQLPPGTPSWAARLRDCEVGCWDECTVLYFRKLIIMPTMGLLPNTQNCGLCMRWECQESFPHHRRLAIPTCITACVPRTCRDACRDC